MFEQLSSSVFVETSRRHTFGTDALLLASAAHTWAPEAKTVCDLGTGCGIVPLALAAMGSSAVCTGIDLEEEAICQFRRGISRSGCPDFTAVTGDFRQKDVLPAGTFQLVTANPPYFQLGRGILPPDPARARARYEISCTPDDLCRTARRISIPGGKLIVCYPPARLAHILRAMEDANFTPRLLQMVQQGPAASPWLFLLMGQKGAGDDLKILPPLLHKPNDPYKEVLTCD